jgi:hypothetical protein
MQQTFTDLLLCIDLLFLGGPDYRFNDTGDPTKAVRHWLKLVSRQDAVFLRGLASLIKAHMAWEYPEFGDAACIYQWIALDAAHSLTLRRLRAKGNKNPTSQDAAAYFEEVTDEKTIWTKFFATDYENRIRAIHPGNRFGAEAHPQFLADDFLELRDLLMPYFRFLLTGVYESPSALLAKSVTRPILQFARRPMSVSQPGALPTNSPSTVAD